MIVNPPETDVAPGARIELESATIYPPELPEQIDAAVLPIDKPKGWSSFDVIRKLRPLLKSRKIGHAGTLDPMATGLLICCTGRMTKRITDLVDYPKTYIGTIRLGAVTASFDAETPVVEERGWQDVSEDAIEAARRRFLGEVEQVPPMYSAVKVGGERLYKKARRGESIERAARCVLIERFDITSIALPEIKFEVRCSKGTYIRSLAHDFGQVLGTGAYLASLRRTAIGPYSVDNAWSMDQLHEAVKDT